jgi:hypothetical protein
VAGTCYVYPLADIEAQDAVLIQMTVVPRP